MYICFIYGIADWFENVLSWKIEIIIKNYAA